MNDDLRLGDALRREADAHAVGPAPVDAVLRRGRAARTRRRAAVAGAATVTAALAVLAYAGVDGTHVSPSPAPPATAPAPSASTGRPGVRTLQPYEVAGIGHGQKMVLLPEGEQNYVVQDGDIQQAVAAARQLPGDNIRPDSVSGGLSSGEGLVHGAFRTDSPPARIVIRVADKEYEAGVLSLRGEPDWGTYYAFPGPEVMQKGYTVTVYAADGSVLVQDRFNAT
ncbi:hypothetical protein [Streptomyces sp. NBC_00306]|uniref:hypothetical protein n=1 Tax=Streptomyces sp. NBC_00306 TaxID=2975708 RepID=UPI002E27F142|nr:hypothetical protein [Streptomyces sp. NBC_00306]